MRNIGIEHYKSLAGSQLLSAWDRRAITISRQAGCGALVVAQKVAAHLKAKMPDNPFPWTIFDRNLMEKVMEEHDLPKYLARCMPEDRVSKVEDLMANLLGTHPPSWKVMTQTTETVLHLAALGNVIIIGRGGSIITAKLPDVLHVRLVAPLDKRIAHACEAHGMTETDARAFCLREDRGRKRYLEKYFHADNNDPLHYHLIINTGVVSYDEAARLIGDTLVNLE